MDDLPQSVKSSMYLRALCLEVCVGSLSVLTACTLFGGLRGFPQCADCCVALFSGTKTLCFGWSSKCSISSVWIIDEDRESMWTPGCSEGWTFHPADKFLGSGNNSKASQGSYTCPYTRPLFLDHIEAVRRAERYLQTRWATWKRLTSWRGPAGWAACKFCSKLCVSGFHEWSLILEWIFLVLQPLG